MRLLLFVCSGHLGAPIDARSLSRSRSSAGRVWREDVGECDSCSREQPRWSMRMFIVEALCRIWPRRPGRAMQRRRR